jgi:predicted transcriptional regulator
MSDSLSIVLKAKTVEKLQAYAELLNKEPNTIINEALEDYFTQADKAILEKSMQEKDPDTDIGFDEFWDDVDFD